MSTAAAIYASVGLGIIVGLVISAVVFLIARVRSESAAMSQPLISADVEEVLAALPQTAIVSDPSHQVLRASFGATNAGLVTKDGRLAPILIPVATKAWESEHPVEATKKVPRGPFGSAGLQYRIRSTRLAPRFILTLAQDVTEAIRVEEVRRDFVANVSHELKTPIGAVSLLAEAVHEAADDTERVRYFAGRMLVESDRLARLTRELIDLSRLQAMDALENAEVVDMAEIVEQAIDLTRVPASARNIRVRAKTVEGAEVWGDTSFLLICVQNLITNAITYSLDNSSVGLGMRKTDDVIEISVADQGIGISEADQGRIFERFYRVDTARSRNTGGTGLGLSIVRHIVENHGGEIRVWSKPGEGSTFTIRIPRVDAKRSEAGLKEAPATAPIQLPRLSPERG